MANFSPFLEKNHFPTYFRCKIGYSIFSKNRPQPLRPPLRPSRPPSPKYVGCVWGLTPMSYLAIQIRGWRNLDWDAFHLAQLKVPAIMLTRLTSRSLTSSQPTKQPWLTSSTRSYRYVRPDSVDLCSLLPSHGLSWSVEPFVAKPAVVKDYRRTRLPANRSTWMRFVRDMHRRYRDKERTYFALSNAKDSKRLWNTFDAILNRRVCTF